MGGNIATPGPVPKEALAFFRAKKLKPGFDFRDVWREEHATNFTVAKAMNLDVLTTIREAVDRAIADGITFQQFQRELRPTLEKLGWWGVQDRLDPVTGEVRTVQLGSPRRLRTIYQANLRTARAAGQWERIERNRQSHPYLLYRLGPSENHRAEHVAWDGLLLPIDDPFWAAHMPPNGWGCKCHVRQVSKREYERLKASGRVLTKAPPTRTREWINKRTGEVTRVPIGIDPGWDTNPGQIARLSNIDHSLRRKAIQAGRFDAAVATVTSRERLAEYSAWVSTVLNDGLKRGRSHPVGLIAPAEAAAMTQRGHPPATGVIEVEDRLIVGKKAARHQRQGNALSAEEWSALPRGLARPEATLYDSANGTLLYVYPSIDNRKIKVVVKMQEKRKGGQTRDLVATAFKLPASDIAGNIKGGQFVLIRGSVQ